MKNEKKPKTEWTVMIGKKPKSFSTFEEALRFADTSQTKGTRAVDFTGKRIIVIPSAGSNNRDIA